MVRKATGGSFEARVSRYDDVETLKVIVEAETGVPAPQQILELMLQGKILRSGTVLGDYITQSGLIPSLHSIPKWIKQGAQ